MSKMDGKIEYWKSRLLDLSKRNRMINCPLPKEDARVSRTSLLISKPEYQDLWSSFSETDQNIEFPIPENEINSLTPGNEAPRIFSNGVETNQNVNETHKTLGAISRKAKEFTEEKGLNALYLAFGFLHWKENGKDGQEMRSPLLLVPVKLEQEDLFSPVKLSRLDDEITTNKSLEQKLSSDFGVVLPEFNDETEINEYFDKIREVIAAMGWSVRTDKVQLSLFSFMKINMYHDLQRNADKIKRHQLVLALNGDVYDDRTNLSLVNNFNHDSIDPQQIYSVVDADSSQQDAILLAKRGTSFVLQGPPGTGKSQTITNIIAELIAEGKKVLFVSEKMAALDVVYQRLSRVGLKDFCLTLHSHNAKRREILDQFERSLQISQNRAIYKKEADSKLINLKRVRDALNSYSEELHRVVEPLNTTVYQVLGELAKLRDISDIAYQVTDAEKYTEEKLVQCESALRRLEQIIKTSGYQDTNPWNDCILNEYPTLIFRQDFNLNAEILLDLIDRGISLYNSTCKILDCDYSWSYLSISEIQALYADAMKSPNVPYNWFSLNLNSIKDELEKCINALDLQEKNAGLTILINDLEGKIKKENEVYAGIENKFQLAKEALLTSSYESILDLDASDLLLLYRNEYRTWLRGFIAGYRNARKALMSFQKTAGGLSYAETLSLLDKVATIQNLQIDIDKQKELIEDANQQLLDSKNELAKNENALVSLQYDAVQSKLALMLGVEVEPGHLKELLDMAEWAWAFQKHIEKYKLGNTFISEVCSQSERLFQEMNLNITELYSWQDKIKASLDGFAELFKEDRKNSFYSLPLNTLRKQLISCRDNMDSLDALIDYKTCEDNLSHQKILPYLAKIVDIHLPADQVVPAFKKCFYRSWLDAILPNFPAISGVRRLQKDENVKAFKELDSSQLGISKAKLYSKLVSAMPNFEVNSSGEIALLRREMAKKRKLMSARKLIASLPNLLPTLKPCLMMSPLSVSTYLGDSSFEFDTVVFDEASQVRTEDAIGAIFRAKQAIITGDSKQLPPTDFFSSSTSNMDEYEEDEDGEADDTGAFESLLDEAASLPTQTLLWHYRSRHEHLIAFSNAKIYKGNLITFPSSVESAPGTGIEYVHVQDGFYQRGSRNGNRKEATKVAELVFQHFKEHPERSIGIIAFGEVQQSAIQDAIISMRRANPDFESFFRDDKKEALFIKNLETVQGDERDTIIFSIGYAPDANGKFLMNFGPLSKAGGERRLNVAITRARYNMKLVGSILPTDIDIQRTSSDGPKLLRLYIDFAINGPKAIFGEVTASESQIFDSPFESAVFDFLVENGFDVMTQVGCSGYRIDLAVRHPEYNGRYAIGIECDGAMYHSARTARERDRLRQNVLEDMGWKIYRVWSTDWIKDQKAEGERLIAAVQAAIENYSEPGANKGNTHMEKADVSDFLDLHTLSVEQHKQIGLQEKNKFIKSEYYKWDFADIPTQELAETMRKVLKYSYGLTREELYRETVTIGYGWKRIGNIMHGFLDNAYRLLVENKEVVEENKKITLI